MGVFQKLKIAFRDLALSNPKAWSPLPWIFAANQTNSGANVTPETALTYSAVYNAVQLISGTIASLPLHVYKETANKGKVKQYEYPLYDVLHTQANSEMSAVTFRETSAAHILTWGNMYAEIIRNGGGRVAGLWPITPERVQVKRNSQGRLEYHVRVDSKTVIMQREDILHIPGLGYDGWTGYSVIAMARESIGLAMAVEEFGSRYFGTGTHPGGIVEHPGKLSQQAHDNLKKSLTETYSGLGKAHRLMLLEEGMTWKAIGLPPEDSQFLQTRQFQIPEIARWFNVPPHKLKDLSRATFSNIEHQAIEFVTDSILPWLVRIEQGMNMQLLTEKERRLGYYCEHSVEGLLRGDSATRAQFYNTMFQVGALSINEIREKENLDPVPDGDRRFVPANMVPLDKAGENLNPAQGPDPDKQDDTGDPGQDPAADEIKSFWQKPEEKNEPAPGKTKKTRKKADKKDER